MVWLMEMYVNTSVVFLCFNGLMRTMWFTRVFLSKRDILGYG